MTIDYIHVAATGLAHASEPHANHGYCGAPLIGKIKPVKRATCPKCNSILTAEFYPDGPDPIVTR